MTIEGPENKGLVFYETFNLLLLEHGAKHPSYPFSVKKITDYFGNPDYKRDTVVNGIITTQYAWLFNNHARKDWAALVTFVPEKIISVGYNETHAIIFEQWEEF